MSSWCLLLLLLALEAALLVAAQPKQPRDDDGVPGLSPPLCERPDCTCAEDAVPGRGLRVSCDFGLQAGSLTPLQVQYVTLQPPANQTWKLEGRPTHLDLARRAFLLPIRC